MLLRSFFLKSEFYNVVERRLCYQIGVFYRENSTRELWRVTLKNDYMMGKFLGNTLQVSERLPSNDLMISETSEHFRQLKVYKKKQAL